MTVSKFVQPNYTDQSQSGTDYPLGIDASIAVMAQLAALFAPHESSPQAMKVAVDGGRIFYNGHIYSQAAQTTGVITAPVSNPRIDRVVADLTSAISVVAGTEAAAPAVPAIPDGKIPICQVLLSPGDAVITNSMITDERSLLVNVQEAAPANYVRLEPGHFWNTAPGALTDVPAGDSTVAAPTGARLVGLGLKVQAAGDGAERYINSFSDAARSQSFDYLGASYSGGTQILFPARTLICPVVGGECYLNSTFNLSTGDYLGYQIREIWT